MRDGHVALLLAIVTALSRIPFVADRLWEWDSVLYARALEQGFHVDDVLAGSRPHPPGYILYVAAAAIGKAAGLDSDHALVLVSIAASGVAAAALYLLCRRFSGRALSLLLTAAFATDPLLWLHGEVAMPYVLLAPAGTIIALAFLEARGGTALRLAAASLLFGTLAGFRQDLLLFLLPLWLWMLWPAPLRARLLAAIALGVACLLWFIPSAALSDGPARYIASTLHQFTGLPGVSANEGRSVDVNLVLVGWSLWWGLLLLAPALAVLGLARAAASFRRTALVDARDGAAVFFALWLLPALLFYVFIHIGEWGFVLSLVPGCYTALGWLLRPIVPRLSRPVRLGGGLIVAASAVLGAALFLAGSDPVFSAESLRAHDRATDAKTAYIRAHFPADATVVLASAEVLVARYYLPGSTVWYSDRTTGAGYTRSLDRDVTLVVYEPRARPTLPVSFQSVDVSPGVTLEIAPITLRVLALRGIDIDLDRR